MFFKSRYAFLALAVLLYSSVASAATITVAKGGNVQDALNRAAPGDEVVVEAGGRYVGPFSLPTKQFGPAITVRTSASLPDRRFGLDADVPLMATLASNVNAPALEGLSNAANWKFDGVVFESPESFITGEVVILQGAKSIAFNRIRIVSKGGSVKRGIRGNGADISLTNSYIAGIWAPGQDSQAFAAWDGPGPFKIVNNYLEAAAENVLFGGANSSSAANIPSDILVEGNHMSKRLEWKGQPRSVKNLFELKAARRVVIRNNLFEHNWTDAQNGMGVLFTGRNDEGQAPWSVVEDVLFERNVLRDTEGGINILGYDTYQPSGRTQRITIRQNLIQTTKGNTVLIGSEAAAITIEHNTFWNATTAMYMYRGDVCIAVEGTCVAVPSGTKANTRVAKFAVEGLTYRDNLAYHREYGVLGEDAGIGTDTLTKLAPGYVWGANVLAGGAGQTYPAGTLFPTEAEHTTQFDSDFLLIAGSMYRAKGSSGSDLGWSGTAVPPPPPPPPIDPDPKPGPDLPPPPPPADVERPVIASFTVVRSGASSNYKVQVVADDNSGVVRVDVAVDGVLKNVMTAPTTGETTYLSAVKIVTPGAHIVKVTVYDNSNNTATKEFPIKR